MVAQVLLPLRDARLPVCSAVACKCLCVSEYVRSYTPRYVRPSVSQPAGLTKREIQCIRQRSRTATVSGASCTRTMLRANAQQLVESQLEPIPMRLHGQCETASLLHYVGSSGSRLHPHAAAMTVSSTLVTEADD